MKRGKNDPVTRGRLTRERRNNVAARRVMDVLEPYEGSPGHVAIVTGKPPVNLTAKPPEDA